LLIAWEVKGNKREREREREREGEGGGVEEEETKGERGRNQWTKPMNKQISK
jgi:hypothetical protein